MNCYRYLGIDGIDIEVEHVFYADQFTSDLRKLMEADPVAFHYTVVGSEVEYLDYLEYDISPYNPDVLTTQFAGMLEERDIAKAHAEALNINGMIKALENHGFTVDMPKLDPIDRIPADECCCKYDHCYDKHEAAAMNLDVDHICPAADRNGDNQSQEKASLLCSIMKQKCGSGKCPSINLE